MSSYTESSINDGYEGECVRNLPIHIKNATGIVAVEPSVGYTRTVQLKTYPTIPFLKYSFFLDSNNKLIDSFEVDFVGHALNDFEGTEIKKIRSAYCDDVCNQKVFYSNFIETDVKISITSNDSTLKDNISPEKENAGSLFRKYIVAEAVHSSTTVAVNKKIYQIERCLCFLKEKSSALDIEDCVALAVVVGPEPTLHDKLQKLFAKSHKNYPLCDRLRNLGRLGFIHNSHTLTNKLNYLSNDFTSMKSEVSDVNEKVSDVNEKVSDVKEQVSDVKEQVSDVKEQVSDVKEQVSGVKEQVSDVKEQIKLLSLLILLLIVLLIVLFGLQYMGFYVSKMRQVDL